MAPYKISTTLSEKVGICDVCDQNSDSVWKDQKEVAIYRLNN